MKNIIIHGFKILSFIFIFCLLFAFLTYFKKPWNYDLQNIAGFYGEKKNSLEMVYIGGSANFVYWEPLKAWEDYGITSYNFGADTIQPELYRYMIEEVLKHQNPKLIIIDARAFQYRDIDQPPTEAAYRNVLMGTPLNYNKYKFIKENVPKYLKDKTISYNFDLVKYHSNVEFSSLGGSIKMMFQLYQNPLKGFYFVPNVKKMKKEKFLTEKVTPISIETTKILKSLLDYIKTKNIEVLFVVSPYIEIESEKENFNYIQSIIESEGYNFLDSNEYSKEMNIDYNMDFYNYSHVNIFGADKYTEFLSKYLKENYKINDKRKNSSYLNWNLLLENWHYQVDYNKNLIIETTKSEVYKNEIYSRK